MTELENEKREKGTLGLMLMTEGFAKKHPRTVKKLSAHHLIYSLSGLIRGLACVIGGVFLFLNGVMGSSS
jgi:hypothetical protein